MIPFKENLYQEYCMRNESIITSKTIEPNAIKTIERINNNEIEHIMSKTVDVSTQLNKTQAK